MKAKKIFMTFVSLVITACMLFTLAACNGGGKVEVTAVMMDRSTLVINIGQSETLSAVAIPDNATDTAQKWSSSDPSVATVANGLVTGISAGKAVIKVTIGGKSDICNVTVNDNSAQAVPVTGITLSKSLLKLDPAQTEKLTVNFTPADATNRAVTFRSTNESVATVGAEDGKVTAVGGGVAVIIATVAATAGSGIQRTNYCVVQVTGEPAKVDNTLYVAKIDSLDNRDDFIMGMDASAVPSIEEARRANGAPTYKNFDGVEEDVFKILKANGITDIRIRVWNDPTDASGNSYGGGNCDIDNAVAIATRCKEAGLGVIIDFHYSDFWADPGKQELPKAWRGLSETEIEGKIYEFTSQSLNKIKATGAKITMVQVGNEINPGMAGSNNWTVVCKYINQGSKAVRDVTGTVANGGAKVAVHFTNPESGNYLTRAKTLKDNSVDYDVFGTSYYPYWHGTLSNLSKELKKVHDTYGKQVMVLETSYAFTYEDADGAGNTALTTTPKPVTVQGQANAVRDVIETVANLGDYGLGVCYWEGTWIAASTSSDGATNSAICKQYGCGWASGYASEYDSDANDGGCVIDNQAFWRSDDCTPLESLKVFKLVRTGQSTSLKADYVYSMEDYYTIGVGEITLPQKVSIVLNNGTEMDTDAYWAVTAEQRATYIEKVDMYTIEGTTEYGGTCIFYAWVMNPNLLEGGSFESDQGIEGLNDPDKVVQSSGLGKWTITNNLRKTEDLQLYVSTKSGNARMGSQSFHFWDSSKISFTLSQSLDLTKLTEYGNGKYSCSFDIMGGNGDDMDIFAYIKVTYKDGTTATTINGNKVQLTDWLEWKRTSASVDIANLANVESIVVGISVTSEVKSGTTGPWGNIDNAQFYFEG